ncbi:MAG: alpha/beta hydrolase [Ilumatobacteraceae bacterium]
MRSCAGQLARQSPRLISGSWGEAMRNRLMTVAAFVGLVVAVGCGADSESTSNTTEATSPLVSLATTTATTTNPTNATTSSSETTSVSSKEPSISLPVEPGSTVEGLVDVGGHAVYARCAGDGSPTIVYFAGWSRDRAKRGVATAPGIENALGPGFRVCSYERRNTGRSETVDSTQTPDDIMADVDGFLAALNEDGPFLLLGASFGGLVAEAYAVAHPDSVVGVVLLDSFTGVDYDIDEQQNFQGACLEANRQADAFDSLERLDNCQLAEWVHDRRDREPAVPLLYLAAQDPKDRGLETDDATRKAWVESWSPGTWRVVDAPHWMEKADPELVANAIREVIGLIN